MPQNSNSPAKDVGPPVPKKDEPTPPIQMFYKRFDPIMFEILSDFTRSQGYPPYELWDFKDLNTETQCAWQVITDVKDVDVTHLSVELRMGAHEHPLLTLHYWGVTEQAAEPLRTALATRTGLPVTMRRSTASEFGGLESRRTAKV
jgi:hypothetical protein